ncbi:mitochondrial translation release factor in rescue-like [Antedon mediterranea]|uniref:mitochondrial translation release factor in rescue-like n=1 Tax=Antedon mediterranea TaxID=105859 RepID=UPI003AF7AC0C
MMKFIYKTNFAQLLNTVKLTGTFSKNQFQNLQPCKTLCLCKQEFTSFFEKRPVSVGLCFQKRLQNLTCIQTWRWTSLAFKSSMQNRQRRKIEYPELNEEDLQEEFVKGSGPGGQSTNKTNNCVVLKHKPTGIVVKCHQTRSQHENQKIARRLLKEKLDERLNGENSQLNQLHMMKVKKQNEKKRRTRIKLEQLKEFKKQFQESDASEIENDK